MKILQKYLQKNPIIYIARDIENALGINYKSPNYFIICNDSTYARELAKKSKNILLIRDKKILDTSELLQKKKAVDFINKNGGNILVFKNTNFIEKIAQDNNWNLLNPSCKISKQFEEKITITRSLGGLKRLLVPFEIRALKDVKLKDERLVIQFNNSHTGQGTNLIEKRQDLEKLQKKFPERMVRVNKYIDGFTLTSNNIVGKKKILIGNISYQITGRKPFTDLEFSTIGNDWGVVRNILNKKQIKEYKMIVSAVGERLRKLGWKGLFGVDIIVDRDQPRVDTSLGGSKKSYLLEINMRQCAGVVYESQLQDIQKNKQKDRLNIFEAHLLSLLDIESRKDLVEIQDGTQIIQRNTRGVDVNLSKIRKLEKKFKVIRYNNIKFNSDLLRIKSRESILDKNLEFNNLGEYIRGVFKS